MPVTATTMPYVFPWKNYKYQLTRLTSGVEYDVATATGGFETQALDIWVDDDWLKYSDALSTTYKLVMTSDTKDECTDIYRPAFFVDGSSGTSNAGLAGDYWFTLSNSTTSGDIQVAATQAATKGTDGTSQELYAIIPGVYIGFNGNSQTAYSTNDEFSWTFKNTVLNGIPKIIDGSHRCWTKVPKDTGDIYYSYNLPYGINNKSFSMLCYIASMPKVVTGTAGNIGITISLEGSVDNTIWTEIFELVDDHDYHDETGSETGRRFYSFFDSDANDGANYPYKRLKLTFENLAGSEKTLLPHQFMDITITPN